IEHVHDALSEFVLDFDDEKWISFSKCLSFISGSLDVKDLATLSKKIDGSALFYLALPPTLFAKAAVKIGEAGLSIESSSYWRRILIEKPFGTDLD
ncbi:glucose-6-phosphate dehydrogenase, partial [Enterobacter cloacae complex sp.6722794]